MLLSIFNIVQRTTAHNKLDQGFVVCLKFLITYILYIFICFHRGKCGKTEHSFTNFFMTSAIYTADTWFLVAIVVLQVWYLHMSTHKKILPTVDIISQFQT